MANINNTAETISEGGEEKSKRRALHTVIDSIIDLAKTTKKLPWQRPWRSASLGRPTNLESFKPYNGINDLLLQFFAYSKGYASVYWLTKRQILRMREGKNGNPVFKDAGIKSGERGFPVVKLLFFNPETKETLTFLPEIGKTIKRRDGEG